MSAKDLATKLLLPLVLLLIAISLGRGLWKNLESAHRVEILRRELASAQKENERLKSELSEKESLEFVEKTARESLGMVKEGEKVLILPRAGSGGKKERTFGSYGRAVCWREWLKVFGW